MPALPAPGLLVQAPRADGVVRLHHHGSDHVRPHEGETVVGDDPHHGRQACSTRTGPAAPGNVPDNHLSVEIGGRRSVRRRVHPLGAGHGDGWDWAASWHRPAFAEGPPMVPGLRVEGVTVAYGRYELRVHRVTGAPEGTRLTHTGWATGPEEALTSARSGCARGRSRSSGPARGPHPDRLRAGGGASRGAVSVGRGTAPRAGRDRLFPPRGPPWGRVRTGCPPRPSGTVRRCRAWCRRPTCPAWCAGPGCGRRAPRGCCGRPSS